MLETSQKLAQTAITPRRPVATETRPSAVRYTSLAFTLGWTGCWPARPSQLTRSVWSLSHKAPRPRASSAPAALRSATVSVKMAPSPPPSRQASSKAPGGQLVPHFRRHDFPPALRPLGVAGNDRLARWCSSLPSSQLGRDPALATRPLSHAQGARQATDATG